MFFELYSEVIFNSMIGFFIFIIGTCIGSFLTMLSYRLFLPTIDVIKRSFCPLCNATIKPKSLIPVFSWLIQGGKCLNCKAKISIRYPLIELIMGGIFLFIFYFFDGNIDIKMLYFFIFSSFLFLMVIVDFERFIIPTGFQFIFGFLILLMVFYTKIPIYSVILKAIISYFLIFIIGTLLSKYLKRESIGKADLVLIAIMCSIFNLSEIALFLFLSGIIGIIYGSIYMYIFNKIQNRKYKLKIFPFGPALIVSFILVLLIR